MSIQATKAFAKNEAGELVEVTGLINAATPSPTPSFFTVNGEVTTPTGGIIQLASKGKYILSGTLTGRVVIGTATDVFTDGESSPTQVILDGVDITTDSDTNAAIEYVPEADKMILTIVRNTVNRIQCSHVAAMADSQKGAIHAENDLLIGGSGYLAIVNKGGHGIKASELRVSGNPHIYCEAVHDGIHGNKMIAITGGVFSINGANDGFGTRAAGEGKEAGSIWLFGGRYYAYGIRQTVFDSKAPGYIFCQNQTMNTKDGVPNTEATGITLSTDVAAPFSNMSNIDPETYFGEPVVEGATLADGVYTATQAAVTISGYFKDVRFVFPIKSTEVSLLNAYIETSTGDALTYTQDSKNIKVTAEKDTVNIIKTTGDAVCINSLNNIAFEVKNFGFLYMEADENAATGSEISFRDSFGGIISNGGIIGSQILLAEATKTFGGGLNVTSLTARLSGKGQKGNIIVANPDFIGHVYTYLLRSAGTSSLANTYGLDYASVFGSTMTNAPIETREPYPYLTYNSPVTFI